MRDILFVLLMVFALGAFYYRYNVVSPRKMRSELVQWAMVNYSGEGFSRFESQVDKMSPSELRVVHAYVFDFVVQGKSLKDPEKLHELRLVSSKYKILN